MSYRRAVQLARYWNRFPPRNEWWAAPGGGEQREQRVSTRDEILANFAFHCGGFSGRS